MSEVTAYPLTFPAFQPRTRNRVRSRFDTTFGKARDELFRELKRLGATGVILSTNVQLRQDGIPYANRSEPVDPGVAVYFNWDGQPYCLACDRWDRVKDNIRAICLHIEALRGQERWGAGSLKQAFEGYKRLPATVQSETWYRVLGVAPGADADEVQAAYRQLAKQYHPDNSETGDRAKFEQINAAYEQSKLRK
jgi:DnaJ domain